MRQKLKCNYVLFGYLFDQGGVSRVVIGMRNPMTHQWGKPITALHQSGIKVEILGEGSKAGDEFEVR